MIIQAVPKGTIIKRIKRFILGVFFYLRHLQWLARPGLEAIAERYLEVSKRSFLYFLQTAEKIQNSESWRTVAGSWAEYCRITWNVDSSRFSQFRGAAPYAIAILEAGHDMPLEGHLRKMRKHVPLSSPLIAETYALGMQVAKALNQAPSEAVYRRSFEVLEEAERTGGVVQVGEKRFFVHDESSAVNAVKGLLHEVKRIGIDSNPDTAIKTKVSVTARREGQYWIIESDRALPDTIHFSLFL